MACVPPERQARFEILEKVLLPDRLARFHVNGVKIAHRAEPVDEVAVNDGCTPRPCGVALPIFDGVLELPEFLAGRLVEAKEPIAAADARPRERIFRVLDPLAENAVRQEYLSLCDGRACIA